MSLLETGGRIRSEVEHFGSHGYSVVIDIPPLDAAAAALVHELVDRLVEDVRALGMADPVGVLLVILTEQLAEEHAYRRVAERRGVLAL